MKDALTITGLDLVKRAFRELEPRIARKVIGQAERKAAKLFAAEIAAHVPRDKGLLKRTIKVRTSKGPRGSKRGGNVSIAVLVGQAGGASAAGAMKRAWYTYLQERGWTVGKRVRTGGNLGSKGVHKVPGKFFTKRSLQSKETPARELLLREIAAGIEREAKAFAR